jgi:8-oxo-dGTP diphosphatase
MSWVEKRDLHLLEFPQANRSIIQAINLPERILISPSGLTEEDLIAGISNSLKGSKPGMVYLRTSDPDTVSQETISALQSKGISVIAGLKALDLSPDGIHLKSSQLMTLVDRPDVGGNLLSASCHNLEEIEKANQLGLDFIFLSPVKATLTHPEANPLGWLRFAGLVESACMPVYALGGMTSNDISLVKECGGQGIAAITGLWCMESR